MLREEAWPGLTQTGEVKQTNDRARKLILLLTVRSKYILISQLSDCCQVIGHEVGKDGSARGNAAKRRRCSSRNSLGFDFSRRFMMLPIKPGPALNLGTCNVTVAVAVAEAIDLSSFREGKSARHPPQAGKISYIFQRSDCRMLSLTPTRLQLCSVVIIGRHRLRIVLAYTIPS